MNILFYGSCNVTRLVEEVNSKGSILGQALKEHDVSCVACQETDLSENEFLQLIKQQDFIITVPINKEYRNKGYLSTEYILQNKKTETKVLIFVSLHSHYYYFDYGHIIDDGVFIKEPHYLHFKSLFNFYKQGKTEKQFIDECAFNENFKSYQELEAFANNDVEELSRRQLLLIDLQKQYNNIIVIDAVKFIKDNYRDHQMFFSLNHPSNYLLYFIAEQVLEHIELPIHLVDKTIKAFDDKFFLYACQQKYFKFDIYERPVDYRMICNNNNIDSLEKAVSYFYNSYKQQNIKRY